MCLLGYEQVSCGKPGCHAVQALPSAMTARLRETGETFYCPYGHGAVFRKAEPQGPPRELVILRQEVEVCRRRNIEAERKASLAERRLQAARTKHAFFEGGRWRGLCPSCFAEQPRGGKKAGAQRWGKMHCAEPVIPAVGILEASK